MYKLSSKRLAVQRVMQANMFKYMQSIFSSIDKKTVKKIQSFLLSDYMFSEVIDCIDFEYDYTVSESSYYTGFGKHTPATWYDPEEWEEIDISAPSAYKVKVSGTVDPICIAKVIAKESSAKPYIKIFEQIVKQSNFAKLFVDTFLNSLRNVGSEFFDYLSNLVEELGDDWVSESGFSYEDPEIILGDVKFKKANVKSSGAKIKFDLFLEVEIEGDNLQLEKEGPDPDDYRDFYDDY